MRRLLLALCVAAFASAAAPAQAGWRSDRATAIAEVVFPAVADCRGGLQIRWRPLPGLGGHARPGDCTITVSSEPPWRRGWRWTWFCHTVLHEAGHVVGLDHSARLTSIMFPAGYWWADAIKLGDGAWRTPYDPRCRGRGRPYLARHGRL